MGLSSTLDFQVQKASQSSQQNDKKQQEGIPLFGQNGLGYTPTNELFNDFVMGLDSASSMDSNDEFMNTRNGLLNIEYSGRPTNFQYRMQKNNSAFWRFWYLMDFYKSEVSILATIISRSVIELLRYGIDWKPKFVLKCTECGTEHQEFVTQCKHCHGKDLIEPDISQQDYFVNPDGVSFLKKANKRQNLKSVLQSYAESQYQNNQGYILCVTGDVVDENGKVVKSYPHEFIAQDPKFVRLSFDDAAVPGTEYGFTMDDRHTQLPLSSYPDQKDERGEQIYPTHYIIGDSYGGTGQIWQYAENEVFCDNWFSQTLTYGIPIWMDIEDDLLTYHFIEKHQLKRWQYGYVRGLLVLPGFKQSDLQNLAKSIKTVLNKNDNSIPMIATPQAVPGGGDQKVQFVSLTSDTAQDMLAYKNDIRDRCCGRAGVPNVIVSDTEQTGGLNSEGLQLTTFDRYLMDKYDRIDDALAWFLSFFPKITDWELTVTRPPKMNSELDEKIKWANYANQMKNLGFKIINQKDGVISISDEPMDQSQQKNGMGGGGGFPSSFR